MAIGRNPRLLTQERLYLDHAATTPVLPEARKAMARGFEGWANPNSPHAEGRAARALLEEARKAVAQELGWRQDVIFTSGASEAVEIAAARARVRGRALGVTEHAIVAHAMGPTARLIPVGPDGLIDEPALDSALADGPALVAIQHVNNETGVIQSLERIAEAVRARGCLLLADCAQSAGKLALPEADFVAACGHKVGGPPGTGVLLVKDLATLDAVGGQEKGYRRGTQDMPAALGFAAALASRAFADAMPRLKSLRQHLDERIVEAGGIVIAAEAPRIPTISAYAMPSVSSASQLAQFDLAGISISAGSACSSGSMKPSRVLEAMGLASEIASSAIRVSFGPDTSEAEVERLLAEWRRIAAKASAKAA